MIFLSQKWVWECCNNKMPIAKYGNSQKQVTKKNTAIRIVKDSKILYHCVHVILYCKSSSWTSRCKQTTYFIRSCGFGDFCFFTQTVSDQFVYEFWSSSVLISKFCVLNRFNLSYYISKSMENTSYHFCAVTCLFKASVH